MEALKETRMCDYCCKQYQQHHLIEKEIKQNIKGKPFIFYEKICINCKTKLKL